MEQANGRAHIDGTAPELLGRWLMEKNRYLSEKIYNMDETGYAISTTQSSRVLVVLEKGADGKSHGEGRKVAKKIPGRQEWVTAIECVSAAGCILPPFMIFKGLTPFRKEWEPEGRI